ncbi:MAG: ABC transporter permease [Symbiobacteriaceae bacterium]|nr:ABC transporter permease [Symbiobacteriaceae bacterium]
MTKLLLKKVQRSMWEERLSYLACVLVIGIGIMLFVALSNVSDSLNAALDSFYAETRLAEVFAQVRQMPRSSASALNTIAGIKEVMPRLVLDVPVYNISSEHIVTLRLHGTDPEVGNPLNAYIFTGKDISDLHDILVDPDFLVANSLDVGANLQLVIAGKLLDFIIGGTFQGPEFVYTVAGASGFLPDPERFGIAYVHLAALEAATGYLGYINDLTFSLEEGYTFKDIQDELATALSPYGLLTLYELKDHVSFFLTDMEVSTIGSVSKVMPLLFLGIAGAVLYIMMRRMIEQERSHIGTLKAFGYNDSTVMLTYMLHGSITGLIGGVYGALLGIPVTNFYYTLMLMFFKIPNVTAKITLSYSLWGIILSLVIATLAALMGVRGALNLRPAEAMRPAAPTAVTATIWDRSPLLKLLLTSRGMMSLRYLVRNPLRAIFIALCMTLSTTMMTVIFSFNLMIEQMMYAELEQAQTFEYKVTLLNPADYTAAVSAIAALEGTRETEAILEMPLRIQHQNRHDIAVIIGVPLGARLYHIIDDDYTKYQPLQDGLILSAKLAAALGAIPGSVLEIESPWLSERVTLPVAKVIAQPFGNYGYLELEAFCALLGSRPLASTIMLNVANGYDASFKAALLAAKNIATVENKARILQGYRELMDPFAFLYFLLGVMAIGISFVVIYNISRVSLSERNRELATMRVLGMSVTETNEVIAFEHWLLCAVAVIAAIPMALGVRQGLSGLFDTDIFAIPTTTPFSAFVYSTIGSFAAVWLANRSVSRAISKFDLVQVLKERE